jgi:hypothetical protein
MGGTIAMVYLFSGTKHRHNIILIYNVCVIHFRDNLPHRHLCELGYLYPDGEIQLSHTHPQQNELRRNLEETDLVPQGLTMIAAEYDGE